MRVYGATEFINSAALRRGVGSIQEHLVAIMGRGLDLTFDGTGDVNVMRAALEASGA